MKEREEFDLFISYAKEDEPRAKDLANSLHRQFSLRVYFAPQQLLADEANAQALLIAALKGTHVILLLWSLWVDKSEWVALETSVFATDRSAQGEKHQTRLAVLDLGGPLLPAWLPYDVILQPAPAADLARVFQSPDWWQKAAKPQQPGGPLSIAAEVLFRLPAWNTRVRAVLPRVGPKFSISHLRAEDLRSIAVARLIRHAFATSTLCILVIGTASLALWAWVLTFPIDWQGYVPRGILLSAGVAFSAAMLLSLRIGVAAGVAAGISGSICGSATALVAAYFCRPDPWAGAVAIGSALGSAAAISLRTRELSAREEPCRRLDWRPLVGVLLSLGLVGFGQTMAQAWAISNSSPPAIQRAVFAGSLGAFIFAPIAAITGWFAHLQIRFRYRLRAFAIGVFAWVLIIAMIAFGAAYVPFGNPFDLRDGIGVGLLGGAVAAGLLTIIAPSLTRLTGDAASVPWAVAVLLAIGFPVLKLFPNVNAGTIYSGVCLTAPVLFLALARRKWSSRN